MYNYSIVNAFSETSLAGNPVAIFFDTDDLPGETMQKISAEINLSETTFVSQPKDNGDAYVRIFTPVNELSFAGHPLLGTALALSLKLEKETLNIETAKGKFQFTVKNVITNNDKSVAHVEMEQPTPIYSPYGRASELLVALGLESSTLPIEIYDVGPRHVLVGVSDISTLSSLNPDQRALATHNNIAAVCFCNNNEEWRMRMFSPAYGVVEDAATGSAAGPFALHLARHGLTDYARRVNILQGVEMGRPSKMYGIANIVGSQTQLQAGGFAITVAQGKYFI